MLEQICYYTVNVLAETQNPHAIVWLLLIGFEDGMY